MGRTGAKVPNFCINRIRPLVKVRSPSIQSKNNIAINSTTTNEYEKTIHNASSNCEQEKCDEVVKQGKVIGRKIMIVIESNVESKIALHWALTHTVQNHDIVILLYVKKCSSQGDDTKMELSPRVSEFLSSMKNVCKQKRPEVQTEVVIVEAKENGPIIVEEAKKQEVALLIMGHKKKSTTWRLLMMWAGNRVAMGMVEYCIQNATCMAIAVRSKSKKLGGYLITTKRHKDFWLLA